jgi:signal peptidase I
MFEWDKFKAFWQEMFIIAFIALVIRTFIFEPFYIPSPSMEKTLMTGDLVVATKYDYGYSKHTFLFLTPQFIKGRLLASQPDYGDVVIFRSNHDNGALRYIKRLVGMPGDKLQMISGILYINDKQVGREFIDKEKRPIKDSRTGQEYEMTYRKYVETLPNGVKHNAYYIAELGKDWENNLDNTKEFTVPEDHYFMMGDNRNNSNDSREDIGFVPFENLIAKGKFVMLSFGEFFWMNVGPIEQIGRVIPWITSLRCNRIFKNIYGL